LIDAFGFNKTVSFNLDCDSFTYARQNNRANEQRERKTQKKAEKLDKKRKANIIKA